MAIARPKIVLPIIEQPKIVPLNILHIRVLRGSEVWFWSNVITTLVPDNRAVGLEVAKAGFQFAEVEICKLATHPSLQPSWVLSGALAYLRVLSCVGIPALRSWLLGQLWSCLLSASKQGWKQGGTKAGKCVVTYQSGSSSHPTSHLLRNQAQRLKQSASLYFQAPLLRSDQLRTLCGFVEAGKALVEAGWCVWWREGRSPTALCAPTSVCSNARTRSHVSVDPVECVRLTWGQDGGRNMCAAARKLLQRHLRCCHGGAASCHGRGTAEWGVVGQDGDGQGRPLEDAVHGDQGWQGPLSTGDQGNSTYKVSFRN